MNEQGLPREDLMKGVSLVTTRTHTIVLNRRPVRRLEVEDTFYNTGSAVFLPGVPAPEDKEDGESVDFSNAALWRELEASHQEFTETVREEAFDPEGDGDAGGDERESGLEVIVAALRFLEQNPTHKLVVAGHADRSGTASFNLGLSDARARGVLAVLEGVKADFVKAGAEYNAAEDDAVILRFFARELDWDCDPGSAASASADAIREFQRTYNEKFKQSIAVDGDVGNQTRGAYFDVYQDFIARYVGGASVLEALRGQLRFVDSQRKYLACGEEFPIENPERDGFRSQRNRRVELLFFGPPDFPKLSGSDAARRVYKMRFFRFSMLDRDELATPAPIVADDDANVAPPSLADASPPPAGVGEPEEELETSMAAAGEIDPEDPWAFLDAFDEELPDAGPDAGGTGERRSSTKIA